MGITFVIAGAATVATVQFLKAPGMSLHNNETVVEPELKGVQSDVLSNGNGSVSQQRNFMASTASIYSYAIIALGGNIDIDNNSTVTSDIYANGKINISNNSNVQGNAIATGTISLTNNATIGGDATAESISSINDSNIKGNTREQLTTSINFIDLPDLSAYLGEAKTGGTEDSLDIGNNETISFGPKYITGNITIGNNSTLEISGTIWVKGNITFNNNAVIKGPGTIICENDITISKNTQRLPADDIPLIISQNGNITVNNSEISAILYAPNGTIEFEGNGEVFGSIIGKNININNNNKVIYTHILP